MSAIDIAIDKIIEEKNNAISKMEWWQSTALGWRNQCLEDDVKTEAVIASLEARVSNLERKLQQFTDIDL